MTTTTARKDPPVLVAVFAKEAQLWAAVEALEALAVSRDFVGALVARAATSNNAAHDLCLVSVFAPSRRYPELCATLEACGALEVGTVQEVAERYGVVPHPGCLESQEMKLPLGGEYPTRAPRPSRKAQSNGEER